MKYNNLGKVTVISLGFFVLFTAFNSASNLSSKAMQDDGLGDLGFYSLGALYLVFGLTSFLAPWVVNKIGIRYSEILGAFGYFFWIFSFLCPAFYPSLKDSGVFLFTPDFIYVLLMLSAVVNGVGAGLLWVA